MNQINYRYILTRELQDTLCDNDKTLGWILFNPSTADENCDDRTIKRVKSFTQAAGYKRLWLLNIIPCRATNPKNLYHLSKKEILGDTATFNKEYCSLNKPDKIVCAWGALAGKPLLCEPFKWGFDVMQRTLGKCFWESRAYCLKTTKAGHPGHPLYVDKMMCLKPFNLKHYTEQRFSKTITKN